MKAARQEKDMDAEDKVRWVYDSKNNQDLTERYDQWAETYEQNLEEEFDYTAPQATIEFFARYVPKEARVLDAGAGTGLVGKLLRQQGYRHLVAMDISQGMLAEARKKNVYIEFRQGVLGEPLDFPADSFDAVISVGVFTLGHAPASTFDELIRVTKPMGHIIFTLNVKLYYEGGDFKEKQSALESTGMWELLEVGDKYQPMPKGEPDTYLQVWVYRVRE